MPLSWLTYMWIGKESRNGVLNTYNMKSKNGEVIFSMNLVELHRAMTVCNVSSVSSARGKSFAARTTLEWLCCAVFTLMAHVASFEEVGLPILIRWRRGGEFAMNVNWFPLVFWNSKLAIVHSFFLNLQQFLQCVFAFGRCRSQSWIAIHLCLRAIVHVDCVRGTLHHADHFFIHHVIEYVRLLIASIQEEGYHCGECDRQFQLELLVMARRLIDHGWLCLRCECVWLHGVKL